MVLKSVRPIGENPLKLMEVSIPTPAPEEIRIKIGACGICHTDLHTIEGDLPLPKLPLIPGHQIVGVVENKGEKVSRFRIGDRIGVPWLYSTCGRCEFCLKGRENLCEEAKFTGLNVDGGYAEYMVINENFAYPIPERFTNLEAAPLLCAGIIGYRALRLSGAEPGVHLGLYGFGASAHIVIQIARHWNCQVYVFSRSRAHRQLAKNLGAVWTGEAKDNPPEKLDSAIIFAPAGNLVIDSLRTLKKGGTLVLAGIYMSPIPKMEYSLIYYEKTIRSVANATRQDGEDLLKLAAEIPIKTEIETFPLTEANRALQLLKEGKINGAGVLEV